ncbi:hypothetical protein J3R30DRAFT_2159475 [Lentinula aciculospora]|uniref:DUF6699 domain-containing protein n=1 Tax=Lentinula aciculospora TaxID=153920 RepID=A0A9W9DSJ6_9AGAR|nr:hypothetical protein J3R30DRAFT_2159475 [Lentinula aciculospora]
MSSETRVTFGNVPGGPSRRFGPLHRSTRPARSIMRRPKTYTSRHLILGQIAQVRTSLNKLPQDISNTWLHGSMKPTNPAPHLHYVGSHSRSSVFAFSPLTTPSIRSSSRHRRHHSTSSSSSHKSQSSRHRRNASLPTSSSRSSSHAHGHKRGHSDITHTSKAGLESGNHGRDQRHTTVPNHKSGHRKSSSIDSSYSSVPKPSKGMQISPRQYPGSVQPGSSSSSRGFASPFHHSGSPFNLQGLGYTLPLTYAVHSSPHSTPSPPYNTYSDSVHPSGIVESDPWSQAPSIPPQLSERVHLHSELAYGTGHMMQWNMMQPPQSAISGFSDLLSNMIIYSGVPALDLATQDLLRSPACPGAAKIIIRPRDNNQALAEWMEHWGPLEIYPSSLTFENEITVFEVLQTVYSYFQIRLSKQATGEMSLESKQRIMHARANRVAFEGQMTDKAEWNRPPKRVDVLALWSIFGGFDVHHNSGDRNSQLDEPGWRVVELELRLRTA